MEEKATDKKSKSKSKNLAVFEEEKNKLDVEQFVREIESRFSVKLNTDARENLANRWNYKPELIVWRNREVEEQALDGNFEEENGDGNNEGRRANQSEGAEEGPCSSSSIGGATITLAQLQQVVDKSAQNEFINTMECLMSVLCSKAADLEIQNEVIDLLGYENVEMVGAIIANRASLVDQFQRAQSASKFDKVMKSQIALPNNNSALAAAPEPTISYFSSAQQSEKGARGRFGIQIRTQTDLEVQRKTNKVAKKYKKDLEKVIGQLDSVQKQQIELSLRERLEQQKAEERETLAHRRLLRGQGPVRYPFVFDSLREKTLEFAIGTANFALPMGTTVNDSPLCEQISVPPADTQNEMPEGFDFVEIASLDSLGQTAFEGVERLNVIQSIVFDKAYNSLENMLICAPTGAGKTNIAMLAVLRTIRDFVRLPGNKINTTAFKIIYIAPMKALAGEVTANFTRRLGRLGLKVKECTGDTQLSRKEIDETQMLVLTPEKWDVITRKADDESVSQRVRLLILDEVHLLQDDRGPVIEAIVARTFRQDEMLHQNTRVLGLSATLPNYLDVAAFLRVDPQKGLFFFDSRFRPVPLAQSFIGVHTGRTRDSKKEEALLNRVTYEKCIAQLLNAHQVIVFVHSRNSTATVARAFLEMAAQYGDFDYWKPGNPRAGGTGYLGSRNPMRSAQNAELQKFFQRGMGIHHAGLPRSDRNLMERLFAEGAIRVLISTATLAWGVNLPAKTVIIRGTKIFDVQKGVFDDIGILDVQQIFGRAGRPQFQDSGHAMIVTTDDKHYHYIREMTGQADIVSRFQSRILDNLNAEITRGTVTTLAEAVEWIRYTYFYVRLRKNPVEYGLRWKELGDDPDLAIDLFLNDMCADAAVKLHAQKMVNFDSVNGFLSSTDLGRIAAHFYIKFETVELLNESQARYENALTAGAGGLVFSELMTDEQLLRLVSSANEFSQIKVRDTEVAELQMMSNSCPLPIRDDLTSVPGKVCCLLQYHISRQTVQDLVLASEIFYIEQNATRIVRALFEVALRKLWAATAVACLNVAKYIEQRSFNSPIRHLFDAELISFNTLDRIEGRIANPDQLLDLSADELRVQFNCDGQKLYDGLRMLPRVELDAKIRPLTGTIIQIEATITPQFTWNERLHGRGGVQRFWVFVEDANENILLHFEQLQFKRKAVVGGDPQRLIFTIPILERQTGHSYHLRVASDQFVTSDAFLSLSLAHCQFPRAARPHTDLLDLDPLSLKQALAQHPAYQRFYPNFEYFNPVQTQVFHTLYHSDTNTLIGAPTSSGKTLCAELAIFHLLNTRPGKKCVYIAPLKALVHERMLDWEPKFKRNLNLSVVEVSGDSTPDYAELMRASILITTPEKWDGITRSADTRRYVREVELVVIDEIHLLGVERGAVIEAIVTRIKMFARRRELHHRQAGGTVRLVGLSTALANAWDVAEWMGVPEHACFNFRPNVRPIPIQVYVKGFPGQHYCPRMALMNKPAFKAIRQFSPQKPVLVFVASRRQTRLTAMAFVAMLQRESNPNQWLGMDQQELERVIAQTRDDNLRLTLQFGIGMHHAGLQQAERSMVERLFVERKIQVLVATATLAWGINVPAHLVIVKGTEYFDGKTHKYVDFPVTDVLQMIGRAGRPQFDTSAVALVYVQDTKRQFYKRFLYEPFPTESNLLPALANHVNAEVCAGTVGSRQQVAEYLAGTYLYRRLFANPAFYGLAELSVSELSTFITDTVDGCVRELRDSGCVRLVEQDEEARFVDALEPTPLGRIAAKYYISHFSVRHFTERMGPALSIPELLLCLTDCPEYEEIPVRHNEDDMNKDFQNQLPIRFPRGSSTNWQSPHLKTHLLFQAHFSASPLPVVDYKTDQRSILEACVRIIQAMFDIALEMGWLGTTLNTLVLLQQVFMGRWADSALSPPLLSVFATRSEVEAQSLLRAFGGPQTTVPELLQRLGLYAIRNTSIGAAAAGKNINKSDEPEKRRQKAIDWLLKECPLDHNGAKNIVDALLRWQIVRLEGVHVLEGMREFPVDIHHSAARIDERAITPAGSEPTSTSISSSGAENSQKSKSGKKRRGKNRNNSDENGRKGKVQQQKEEEKSAEKTEKEPSEEALKLKASGEYKLRLRLRLINGDEKEAHCPRYPKKRAASWLLILGNPETNEVLGLGRFSPKDDAKTSGPSTTTTERIAFNAPKTTGLHELVLYVISDTYLGVDQQYRIPCEVIPCN